jgi:amidase
MVRMQNVIAHPHPESVTTLPHEELPLAYPSIRGMKIAYSADQGWAEMDPEVTKAAKAGIQVLRDQGARVDEIDLDLGITAEDISHAFAELALSGPLGAILAGMADQTDQMTTYGAYFVKKAASGEFGAAQALAYQNNAVAAHAAFTEQVWSKGYDALVVPTVATPHIAADYDYTKDKPVINGKPVHPLSGPILTPLFNLLNWYPVVNVPSGLSSRNTPIGLQIVTNSYHDETAMRVANAYAAGATPLFTGKLRPDFRAS